MAEYRKSLGYYQIITSELTLDAREVIDKYHGLTQIEDQFRVMKGDLETRPIYVRTPEHVTAHLLICMIALIMLRMSYFYTFTLSDAAKYYKKVDNHPKNDDCPPEIIHYFLAGCFSKPFRVRTAFCPLLLVISAGPTFNYRFLSF